MLKKVISLLVAAIMCMGLISIPASVSAEEAQYEIPYSVFNAVKACVPGTGISFSQICAKSDNWWSSNDVANPFWVIIDIGSIYNINAVQLGATEATFAPYNYKIYTSTDADAWSSEASQTWTLQAELNNGARDLVSKLDFSATDARYIKIEAVNDSWWRLNNFKVYSTAQAEFEINPSRISGYTTNTPGMSIQNLGIADLFNDGSAFWSNEGAPDTAIMIDMGTEYKIDRMDVGCQTGTSFYATAFSISYATDSAAYGNASSDKWTKVEEVQNNAQALKSVYLQGAPVARYIKIATTQTSYTRFANFHVYTPQQHEFQIPQRLFADITTKAGSNIVAAETICSEDSFWNSNRSLADAGETEYVTIDMGKSYVINGINVGSKDEGSSPRRANDYSVQVSTDGASFTTVKSVSGNNANLNELRFAPVSARYVRIEATVLAVGGWWYLNQVKIFSNEKTEVPLLDNSTIVNIAVPTNEASAENILDASSSWWMIWNSNRLLSGSEWFMVDLGEENRLYGLSFDSPIDGGGTDHSAANFDVYYTSDKAAWNNPDSASWTLGKSVTGSDTTAEAEVNFTSRYVMVRATYVTIGGWWYVKNLKLWGEQTGSGISFVQKDKPFYGVASVAQAIAAGNVTLKAELDAELSKSYSNATAIIAVYEGTMLKDVFRGNTVTLGGDTNTVTVDANLSGATGATRICGYLWQQGTLTPVTDAAILN